jgi:hypothetical protein
VEIKRKTIALVCLFFCGCTSNPFWEDQPTKKLNISGTVTLEDRETDVPVYVWIEGLGLSGHTDSESKFSMDISGLETGDGSFTGDVRVFYYVHNYRAHYSTLYITGGRLSSGQTDFDQDGMLLETVVLEKLASFDVTCDNSWNRAMGDSLRVKLKISIMEHDIGIVSNVKNIDHDYIPSGLMFYLSAQGEMYFDQNNIDYLKQYDLVSGSSTTWNYTIGPDDLTAPAGDYYIRPWFMILQDQVPDALVQSLGITDLETISRDHLILPIDIVDKIISLD